VTSLPFRPAHRYSVAEFAALPEDTSATYELQEGLLVVSPRPAPAHMLAIGELYAQLRGQLPAGLLAIPEIDVQLEGVPTTVRVPDLVIVDMDAYDHTALARSSQVVVAVEVLSPGSVRTDTVVKLMEYADAGIPHFWLIDPEPPVTATVYRLVDGEYQESQRAENVLEVDQPCRLRIDLDALLPAKVR
jgi:Uma2 family endonuclease